MMKQVPHRMKLILNTIISGFITMTFIIYLHTQGFSGAGLF